jgi:hypothetical protein
MADCITEAQIGNAPSEPVSPIGRPSSIPTQTPMARLGVYPTNHESRRSLVVPVFPAVISESP